MSVTVEKLLKELEELHKKFEKTYLKHSQKKSTTNSSSLGFSKVIRLSIP